MNSVPGSGHTGFLTGLPAFVSVFASVSFIIQISFSPIFTKSQYFSRQKFTTIEDVDMTTNEATRELFAWFTKNDTFSIANKGATQEDFKKIVKISENQENDLAAVKTGLKELEDLGLISKVESASSVVWVLKKHIDSYEQTIGIGYDTALQVSEVINSFCKVIGNQTDEANPTKIIEKDIKNLALICIHFSGQIESLSKKED